MKTTSLLRIAFGMIALALMPIVAHAAEKASFSIKIVDGKAVVADASGKAVATLPAGTVGKTLSVGGNTFQVTYGSDPAGGLVVAVSPVSGSTAPLTFSINGKTVEVAPPALGSPTVPVVNVAISSSGQTVVSSTGGGVKVDGKPAVSTAIASISTTPGGSQGNSGSNASNSNGGAADLSNLAVTPDSSANGSAAQQQSPVGATISTPLAPPPPRPPNPNPIVVQLNASSTTPF
ncbi:MAG TPA: hypothetical protein VIM58_05820 [Candidatus Methylacidiphilales bacterium]